MTHELKTSPDTHIPLPTDYAPAERSEREILLRQHTAWMAEEQTRLIGDAVPNIVLVLNNTRQVIYANSRVSLFGNYTTPESYLGLRVGELISCTHAFNTPGGCGTTIFCQHCGAVNSILISMIGNKNEEECTINRNNGEPPYQLRVMTTPVKLNGEDFVMFSIQDIHIEKENQRLLKEVQRLAVIDPLTGVNNRRAFFERAEREFTRGGRYQRPLVVIMLDVDKFKNTNDTFGHPVGDTVLKTIAQTIKAQLRDLDLFARYGGDEFIALLPEIDFINGNVIARRITEAVSLIAIEVEGKIHHPSISAGVAAFDASDRTLENLIMRADVDLRTQKQNKRYEVK